MLKRIAKLIDVKSLVTLTLTGVFAYLSITSKVTSDQFLTIFTTIIAFFFGTKIGKQEAQDEKEDENDGKGNT